MKIALRIGYNRYYCDEIFAKHLTFIKNNCSVIDEITLFAEFSHYGYWDLKTSAVNAEVLKNRIQQYKDIGIKRVGINVLCTIGHIEEGFEVLPKADLQYQVNQDGAESKSCLCPSNDAFLDYTAKRYAIYANSGADFIWIDDDVRPNNHGIAQDFCYCPKCIQKFNDINKTNYTRKEIVEGLNSSNELRNKWNDFKENVMKELLFTIKEAVKGVNESIDIGFMSIDSNAKKDWILASGASICRPGGGFYNDEKPIELFEKSFHVQKQIIEYPSEIHDIQYEYEAFNYQSLGKSIHISELETSLSIMSGCNGVLYNHDVFNDRQDLIDMLNYSADKWKTLVKVNAGCKNAGVFCINKVTARLLNEISLPVTSCLENASVAVILGKEWTRFSTTDIKKFFKKGVFTDGAGVETLCSLGYGEFCGGEVKHIYSNGMAERFNEHYINESYKNYYRDVYMNFIFEGNAYEFKMSDVAEEISQLETITHEKVGCSMYRYESPLGRRFVADGYFMLQSSKSAAKREQIGNVIDWLSHERLPIRIKKSIKIIPTVTMGLTGEMNIMLTNASFDKTGSFEICIRGTGRFYIINQSGELLSIIQRKEGKETIVEVNNIDAWSYILITNQVL